MMDSGKMDAGSGSIVSAAVNNHFPVLEKVSQEELEQLIKKHASGLVELKLDKINKGAVDHNLIGLVVKGLETLDLIEHPPKGNPASTFRDCIEANSFIVPALELLGYKRLAAGLRGAALKWLFEDPNGDAKRQYDLSDTYFPAIKTIATDLLEQRFGGITAEVDARVKTEGSLREKLQREAYEGLHWAPDGVGLVFIVPDEMAGDEMRLFAEDFRDKLTANPERIEARHPSGKEEDAFEDMQGGERKSGYKAIHTTFYYHPDGNPDIYVPFEIQIVTQTQNKIHLHGRASHLYRETGTEYKPEDDPHHEHFERRGRAQREMSPGSTVRSVAEMVAALPEIHSVFNELFCAVETPNGDRLLIPKELEALTRENMAMFESDTLGESGDLTVLPAAKVSEAQFWKALKMFSRDLEGDRNIRNALDLVKSSGALTKRDDGETTVLEGHILPTTLAAVMLAIQSGEIWDSKQFNPNQEIANLATIAILHDYVEKLLEGIKDPAILVRERQNILFGIKRTFGETIMNSVGAMTLPLEIEDTYTRREQYRNNLQADHYARLIKPADRWQNHITDLIKLATGRAPEGSELYKKIMVYFGKTDRHQTKDFTSEELPEIYPRIHDIIWRYAKHFGYKPESIAE
jgi:hypothetical protein